MAETKPPSSEDPRHSAADAFAKVFIGLVVAAVVLVGLVFGFCAFAIG